MRPRQPADVAPQVHDLSRVELQRRIHAGAGAATHHEPGALVRDAEPFQFKVNDAPAGERETLDHDRTADRSDGLPVEILGPDDGHRTGNAVGRKHRTRLGDTPLSQRRHGEARKGKTEDHAGAPVRHETISARRMAPRAARLNRGRPPAGTTIPECSKITAAARPASNRLSDLRSTAHVRAPDARYRSGFRSVTTIAVTPRRVPVRASRLRATAAPSRSCPRAIRPAPALRRARATTPGAARCSPWPPPRT